MEIWPACWKTRLLKPATLCLAVSKYNFYILCMTVYQYIAMCSCENSANFDVSIESIKKSASYKPHKHFVHVVETWSHLQIGSLPPMGRAWERGANWYCFKCANWHQCTKCFLHKMCKLTPLHQMCKSANWHSTKRCRPLHQVQIQMHQMMGYSWCRQMRIWGERLMLSENKPQQKFTFQYLPLNYITLLLSCQENKKKLLGDHLWTLNLSKLESVQQKVW